MITTHIYRWAPAGEPQHVLKVDCWCGPEVTQFPGYYQVDPHVVVAHSGEVQPSVHYVPSLVFTEPPAIRGAKHTHGGFKHIKGDAL